MNGKSHVLLGVGIIAIVMMVVLVWLDARPTAEPETTPEVEYKPTASGTPPAADSHDPTPVQPFRGRIEGVVSWKSGAPPPADAIVTLECYVTDLRERFPLIATLDSDGHYAFDDLPRSVYEIKCGREPVVLSGQVLSGRQMVRQGVRLTEQHPVAREDFLWEDVPRVAGVVVNESGSPIAGAIVTSSLGQDGDATATDQDGRFELWRLAPGDEPGTYRLIAVALGYAAGTADVTFAGGDPPVQVRIILTRGTELRGRVIDAQGKPVAEAFIAFEGSLWTIADGEGNYVCQGLSAGEQSCQVKFDRGRASVVQSPVSPNPLVIPPGQQVFKQDIVVSFEGGVVSGVVVNAIDAPRGSPESQVYVEGVQGAEDPHRPAVEVGQQVDEKGRFRLSGFDQGPVDLTAFCLDVLGVVRVQVPAGTEGLRIELPSREKLIVQVSDEYTGSPVTGAKIAPVFYESPEGESSRSPRSWGQDQARPMEVPGLYQFDQITPGRLAFKVEAEGYASRYFADISVIEDVENSAHFALVPGVTCTCQVVLQGYLAEIADRLTVAVLREGIPDMETVNRADKDPQPFAYVLAQGDNIVTVTVGDRETRQSWHRGFVLRVDTNSSDIVLPIGGGGIVEGTVPIPTEGRPPVVKIRSTDGTNSYSDEIFSKVPYSNSAVRPAPDGQFRFYGIEPGSYFLRYSDYQAKFEVAEGRTTVIGAEDLAPVEDDLKDGS